MTAEKKPANLLGPLLLGLVAWLLGGASVWAGTAAEASFPKPNLRVMYFGRLNTERAKDFVQFLQGHFAKVGSGEIGSFQEAQVKDYDVVLMDYDELKLVDNHIQMPPNPFARSYSRPTVMIGATAALMSRNMGLKTGYL